MKVGVMMNLDRFNKYAPDYSTNTEIICVEREDSIDLQILKLKEAEIIVVDSSFKLTPTHIASLPALRMVHTEGVGYNHVCYDALLEHNISLCNNPKTNAESVAEQTLLLMLGVLRKVRQADQAVREAKQIEYKEKIALEGIRDLSSCTVGLIGWGFSAREVAKRLKGFGCKIIYSNRTRYVTKDATYLERDDLLKQADIVSLHIPAVEETRYMVNQEFLSKMKPGSILINAARGDLVDQQALKEALIHNHLAGAGLDTLYPEPVEISNPLLTLDNVLFSPHIGGVSNHSLQRMHHNIWENIRRYMLKEELINQILE